MNTEIIFYLVILVVLAGKMNTKLSLIDHSSNLTPTSCVSGANSVTESLFSQLPNTVNNDTIYGALSICQALC